jgi:hypothetical protein
MSPVRVILLLPLLGIVTACKDVGEDGSENDGEVITTVELEFVPVGGGDTVLAAWSDPENDGSPTIDPITLADANDYTLSVAFLNELAEPAEDITVEVEAEGDEHQVFFTGDAVSGPAAGENASALIGHAYADADGGGLPVGLINDITTLAPGSASLTVTLRHMPPEDGAAVKVDGVAEQVASGGFESIGGDNDVQVTFELTVQ